MNFKKFISGVSAFAIAAGAFAGMAVTASAATVNVDPTAVTTIHAAGSDSTKGYADTNYYDATATSWRVTQASYSKGAFADGQAKYDGSYLLISKFDVSGYDINKATLSFDAQCTVSGKDSNIYVATINTTWNPATATWNTVYNSLSPSKFDETGSVGTTKVNKTFDVTNKISNGALGIAIYTYTAREQEISNLKLILDYTPAAADAATVTLNLLDGNGAQVADPVTVNNLVIGDSFDPSAYAPATVEKDLTDANGTYHQAYAYSSAAAITSLAATQTVDVTYAASGDPYVYVTWNKGTSSTNQFAEHKDVEKVTKSDDQHRYNYQHYLNHDNAVYKYSGNGAGYKCIPNKDQTKFLEYSLLENGVYFAEGEVINSVSGTLVNEASYSGGKATSIYTAAIDGVFADITCPEGGFYKVTIPGKNTNKRGINIIVGETVTRYDVPVTGANIEVPAGAHLKVVAATTNKAVDQIDYVLIERTGDLVETHDNGYKFEGTTIEEVLDKTVVLYADIDNKLNKAVVGKVGDKIGTAMSAETNVALTVFVSNIPENYKNLRVVLEDVE